MATPSSSRKLKWSNLYTFACLRSSSHDQSEFGQQGFSRVVFCNESQKHRSEPHKYPNNHLSTTKYNVVTFLPKSLFEQFRKAANLYFLLVAVISLTPLAPFPPVSCIAPLVFVVGASLVKEGVEDWRRFYQDKQVNSRKIKIHTANGVFDDRAWKEVRVGDVVKVLKDEYFPSDILLLSSSYEDGICYVETMNLDGETNLKVKRGMECTLGFDDAAKFDKFKATIRCEDPNPSIYTFVGNLELGDVGETSTYPISHSQILLRDSKLRNTEFVYGVVIFTGRDTKVARNSMIPQVKRSTIERRMNRVIFVMLIMMGMMSLITSVGSVMYTNQEHTSKVHYWYLRLRIQLDLSFNPNNPLVAGFLLFLRALVLYGYLIPVSLYVSIEVVKVIQGLMINSDQYLYDEVSEKSAEARTSNLNEELGQVEMVLTDKTGTLTCNQMEFRKCSIDGISYGDNVDEEIASAASERMDFGYDTTADQNIEMVEISSDPITELKKSAANIDGTCIRGFNFRDARFTNNTWLHGSDVWDIMMFLRLMALCHTGIPITDEHSGSNKLTYEAESPEEVSFLIAAQELGFQFFRRTQSSIFVKEIDLSGEKVEREYKLLNLLEFNSSRKRMSVIVRDEAGQILLFCKGADNIILERLGDGGRAYQHATAMHLASYAEQGLRTMVFTFRKINTLEYDEWNSSISKAKATIGPDRETLLDNISDIIERELVLLGAVAIEDKLQDGVPGCIDKLARAGIKIWLLTGDKKETAVNVGLSCNLLSHDTQVFHLGLRTDAETNNQLQAMNDDIFQQIQASYQRITNQSPKDGPFALVVDGRALEIVLIHELKDHFLRLAVKCNTVICCRVSPRQKALITQLVKKYTGKITLAIGDGANDVGMIQEAHIGIGISGMEGMQAVMASDFSVPQFRFLERLLLVHGHWSYRRISKMILYFVYKNIVFGFTLFFYEVYSRFSGDVLYDGWYMVMYNLCLTSLPVISLGILEQDVSSNHCIEFPALYQQGQKNISFGWKQIIGWMSNGILTSLIVFILNVYMLSPAAFRQGGEVVDIEHLGVFVYTTIVWTVNCQIALIITHFTWIQHILIWGSILLWYVFLLFYGALSPRFSHREYRLLVEAVGPAPMYWIVILLVVVVSLLPYFICMVVRRTFYPTDDQVIQEIMCGRKVVVERDGSTTATSINPIPQGQRDGSTEAE